MWLMNSRALALLDKVIIMYESELNLTKEYLKRQGHYLREFITAPGTFGTLVPSSPWLCNKMLMMAEWQDALTVAELGAGDGVLTKKLLSRMTLEARLDAYEISTDMAASLQQLARQDPRLNVIIKSATQLNCNYDIIFCCLPLLSIPPFTRLRIIRKIYRQLNPGGRLILFQYSLLSEKTLSRYFSWKRTYEARNFPPAWVYECTPIQDAL